jgi:hypothetical protein
VILGSVQDISFTKQQVLEHLTYAEENEYESNLPSALVGREGNKPPIGD